MKFKKWLEQMKCLHYWQKGLPTDLNMGRGYKHEWTCKLCKKRIERWYGNEPISGAPDPEYQRLVSAYNLSPPIIKKETRD